MLTVEELVAQAKRTGASDVHLICGLPPKCRLDGQLENMAEEVLSQEDCVAVAKELAGSRYGELEESGELDLAGTFAGNRCRLHLFKHFERKHGRTRRKIVNSHTKLLYVSIKRKITFLNIINRER